MKIEDGFVTSEKGAKIKKSWNPKKWKPEYELICHLAATKSNTALAELFGYTPQQISNILNCQRGLDARAKIAAGIRQQGIASMGERISSLQSIALQRLEEVLTNDNIANQSPLKMFDKASRFLSDSNGLGNSTPVGHGRGPVPSILNVNVNNTNNVVMALTDVSSQILREELDISAGLRNKFGEIPLNITPEGSSGLATRQLASGPMQPVSAQDVKDLAVERINEPTRKIG